MGILSQPGVSARDLIEVVVVGETENPRGEEYSPVLGAVGDPVKVISKPLTGRERFQSGKTDSTAAYQLLADLEGSEHVTPKVRLWHPEEGKRDAEGGPVWTERLLDVSSVQRYRFGENLTVIECAGTY